MISLARRLLGGRTTPPITTAIGKSNVGFRYLRVYRYPRAGVGSGPILRISSRG